MKRKIVLRDEKGNVLKEGEVNTRNLEHFKAQLMYRAHKEISKKAYNRARDKKVVYNY